jgi:hypothetical protein
MGQFLGTITCILIVRLNVGQTARSMATLREIEQRLKVTFHLWLEADIPVHPKHRENHKDNENRR